tara:strand:+ start:2821 stop:3903 length:1083 start_codon:yes stop_codon:yes gene_type:complete
VNIEKLLIDCINEKLEKEENFFLISGHNGPYFDEETLVRNASHWLIIFSCLYKRTGQSLYFELGERCIKAIKLDEYRPFRASFYCRKSRKKDLSNGLMGQAWVIEALLYADPIFPGHGLYEIAEELFLLHSYDEDRCIWHVSSVDGTILDFDRTFNHQLWFCAVGSLFGNNSQILSMCDRFFENVAIKPKLYKNGVIYHDSNIFSWSVEKNKGVRNAINYILDIISDFKNKNKLYSKSVGYHGFNIYAYTLMKKRYGKHEFFESDIYKKILNVMHNEEFFEDLSKSHYSYAYNPPGFEFSYAAIDSGDELLASKLLNHHFSICLGNGSFNSMLAKDFYTSEARLYELIRTLDIKNVNFEY